MNRLRKWGREPFTADDLISGALAFIMGAGLMAVIAYA